MDRYYACSLNKQNIVECVTIPIDSALRLDSSMVFTVNGQLPYILDSFYLMRKFGLPVRIVR